MKNKTKSSRKKNAWFYKVRGSYLPANKFGWLTYIPYVAYMVFIFIVGTVDIPKRWVAFVFILSGWIGSFAVMTMLAMKKS